MTHEPRGDFTASPIFASNAEQLADALPPLETETPSSAAGGDPCYGPRRPPRGPDSKKPLVIMLLPTRSLA